MSIFGLFSKKGPTEERASRHIDTPRDFQDTTEIALYFQKKTGISFKKQTSILKSKLISFCTLRDIYSFDACLKEIRVNLHLEQELINYLTTNETYFYREFSQIEQLVKDLSKKKSFANILCAPCSTGEESYSIVIALLEAGVSPTNFSIVGIDINSDTLVSAKKGIYSERNVSQMPKRLRSKYFDCRDNLYYLKENIKTSVIYKKINIFDTQINSIGKFDYVLSRNMLIYFDPETKIKAAKILENLLKDTTQNVFYGHADL